MSSTIGILHGKYEFVKSVKDREVGYMDHSIFLTRFAGGNGRATSLQITIGNQHIQLNGETADELAVLLSQWRTKEEMSDY